MSSSLGMGKGEEIEGLQNKLSEKIGKNSQGGEGGISKIWVATGTKVSCGSRCRVIMVFFVSFFDFLGLRTAFASAKVKQ